MTDNIEETNVQPPYSRREILLQEINTQLTGGTAGNIEELVPPPYTREEILLIETLTAIESGGGGAQPFYVTVTVTAADAGTSDKTAAEIIEAVDAGKQIVVKTAMGEKEELMLYPSIVSRYHGVDAEEVAVNCIMIDDSEELLMQVLMPWASGTDNSWQLNTYPLLNN